MNSGVAVHITRDFGGLKVGQPSLFWEPEQQLFEEATGFLNDEYCQSGSRSSQRTWKNVASAYRGRDTHYWTPPAQIPAGAIRAPGSHLGCLAAKRSPGHG